MLTLQLSKGEYITMGDDIVIQAFPFSNRVTLRIDAPRDVTILRGSLSEKAGTQRPKAIAEAEQRGYVPKTKVFAERLREQRHTEKAKLREDRRSSATEAVDTMKYFLTDIESEKLRSIFAEQLEKILPAIQQS